MNVNEHDELNLQSKETEESQPDIKEGTPFPKRAEIISAKGAVIASASLRQSFDPSTLKRLDPKVLTRPSLTRQKYSSEPFLSRDPEGSYRKWSVEKGQELPPFPIGRTNTIDASPKVVAENMCELFRRRSVHVTYNGGKAEATCETDDEVKFKVILWEHKDPAKTILEVMKMRGCCVAFSKIRPAVIKAAHGDYSEEKAPARLTIPDFIAQLYKPPSEDELQASLEQIVEELEQNDSYRQHSSLQLLCAMTDASSSNHDTCLRIATMVLVDDEAGIRDLCLNLLSSETTDDSCQRVKKAVLTFFRNSMNVLIANGKMDAVLNDDNWCSDDLFPLILNELNKCPCPHKCTLLTQCISLLLKSSSAIREKANSMGMKDVLDKAMNLGQMSHLGLYDQAQSALKALECQ